MLKYHLVKFWNQWFTKIIYFENVEQLFWRQWGDAFWVNTAYNSESNLFRLRNEGEQSRAAINNDAFSSGGHGSRIIVAVRIRPML